MPIALHMPALSPTMEEGMLVKWHVCPGQTVEPGDVIAEIETDKAVLDFESDHAGTVQTLLVPEGTAQIKVGTQIALLSEPGETGLPATAGPQASAAADEVPPIGAAEKAAPPQNQRIKASPYARKAAAQAGLDLEQLTGSGPMGRIIARDLSPSQETPKPQAPVQSLQPSPMRRTIAHRMSQAAAQIPQITLRRDINIEPLLDIRKQANTRLAPHDIRLSLTDFFVKACALALHDLPRARQIWQKDSLHRLPHSDIAVAVAVDDGVLTPVITRAETLPLTDLSQDLHDKIAQARTRKLPPENTQGGSFTLSNMGMFGVDSFDALLPAPHSAILAVGRARPLPAQNSTGQIHMVQTVTLSLAADHRVMDGADAARLLQRITSHLNAPAGLLI